MSEANPTIDEIAYLAGLDVVRSDGIDRTAPALAREVLRLRRALEAMTTCQGDPVVADPASPGYCGSFASAVSIGVRALAGEDWTK